MKLFTVWSSPASRHFPPLTDRYYNGHSTFNTSQIIIVWFFDAKIR